MNDIAGRPATGDGPEDFRAPPSLADAPPGVDAAAVPVSAVPGAQVKCLSDVEPEHVEWLWPGYLPLGKLVVLDGDPSVGKSTVAVDLAARVSTGKPMPDGEPGRGGAVLYLSAEDGLADTVRPRLDAAGADPSRVHTITDIKTPGGDNGELVSRPVSLPGDLAEIRKVVEKHGVVLVVVDVLMAYLSDRTDAHRDQDVRRALHPLAGMAEDTGCTVLALRHLNKAGGTHAVYRGGGSIGIVGAARAAFMCGTDPGDDTGTRRVLAPVKNNLAAPPPSLGYRLVSDETRGCARVEWLGASTTTAAGLLADRCSDDERLDQDEAVQWITGYLKNHGNEAKAGDVIRAAEKDGIPRHTLQRARKRAGVTTDKTGMHDGWKWKLEGDSPEGDTEDASTEDLSSSSSSAAAVTFDQTGSYQLTLTEDTGSPPPEDDSHPPKMTKVTASRVLEPSSPSAVTPVCRTCGNAMNRKLADAGYTTHPNCDDAETTTPTADDTRTCGKCGGPADPGLARVGLNRCRPCAYKTTPRSQERKNSQ